MNGVALFILSAQVAEYGLYSLADFLNVRKSAERIPETIADVYDEAGRLKSREYLYANTCFSRFSSSVHLCALLLFWFAGGFAAIDGWARTWGRGPVATGILFIASLFLLRFLLDLPFRIYTVFGIEARFGFNRTAPATFAADLAKGIGLFCVLGLPLLAGVLTLFHDLGPGAWWTCWACVCLFLLVVQLIAPAWIMPLFNRFEPLAEGELRSAILSYARSIDFPLENIFVMDGSRRSSKANAFFTGFGKHRRIVLFDTLIARHPVSELLAVLAHEMGHYRKRHIVRMTLLGIVHAGLVFFLLSRLIDWDPLYEAFFVAQKSMHTGILFFGLLYAPLGFCMDLIFRMLSRRHELEADRFASRTTGNPQALAAALKSLSAGNLSNPLPHPLHVFLHYSHPPPAERIRALRSVETTSDAAFSP